MTPLLVKILLYAAAIVVLAYFAGIETALTSLSTISLNKLKGQYPKSARFFQFWENKTNEILATILVGTNMALVATGVIATSLAMDLIHAGRLPPAEGLAAVSVASILLTLLLGDLLPKIVSRYQAEQVARRGLPFLVRLSWVFHAINVFILFLAEKIITFFSGGAAVREKPFLQPDELKLLLLSDETIPLPVPARKMMRNIIDFAKTRIRRIMVPRENIHAVNLDQEPAKVIEQIIEKEFSRVPVYRGNLDNIVGIIYSRDLALAWRGGSLFVLNDLIRPAYFVPGSARIDQVLREFRTGHHHLAIVVDEFGATVGLATIEDIIEEIVGEIWDEYDIQEKNILPLPDGAFMVKASESLAKVNDELGLNLPAADFASVSGWVLDLFGRIPKMGEKIGWGDIEIEILDADKKRVLRVQIKKRAQS